MIFSSTTFLFLFLPAVLLIYYNPLTKHRGFRNIFLLIASLGFYAWGEPLFVFVMLLSILVTWVIGIFLQKKHSRGLLAFGISLHVLVLFIFKYLTFVVEQAARVFHREAPEIEIAMPIGISFFTFQLMSYLFDIYYKKARAQKNLLNVGLYVSFFPQLIAGPIVRYEHIAAQIENREENWDKFCFGMRRFIYGLGKKVLLADYLAVVADLSFGKPGGQSVLMAWLGATAYSLQIYFDFSGYSDMAIGLGKMFGFDFNENFHYPYISRNVTEFWRRWHISLSSWFRDYVYIPMGGNRVRKSRWLLNLFTVWLLTGIWHGANWTFLVWGLFYFVLLAAEKCTGFDKKSGILSYVYTFVAIVIAWAIFRSEHLTAALAYIGNMFGIGATGLVDRAFVDNFKGCAVILVLAVAGMTPLVRNMFQWLKQKKILWAEDLWMLGVFALSLIGVISSTYSPFIYFNF